MWPFRRKPGLRPDELVRLEAIERRMKVIEADWDEWYDKFRRLHARLSKRVARDEAEASASPADARTVTHPTRNPLAAALLSRGNNSAVLHDG